MTHIAIQETLEGKAVEWLEHVSDDEYGRRSNGRRTMMRNVIVVIGAGSIGQAIARRVSAGKHVVLADLRQENAEAAAKVLLDAGFEVSTATVDVSSRPPSKHLSSSRQVSAK